MFKNYLKISIRNLQKHKGYSLINVLGMAVGIACCLVICSYVYNEMTYDSFHQNADNIYQVYRIDQAPKGGYELSAVTPHPLPIVIRNDYPEIEHVIRIIKRESAITIDGKGFKDMVYFTDANFFEMFNFPLLNGNPQKVFDHLNSVVLVEGIARKYFGDENPIGKAITVEHASDFVVTGIVKRLPQNSSLQFGMLIPIEFLYKYVFPQEQEKWYSSGVCTFVECSEVFSPIMLKNQLGFIREKYVPDWLKGRMDFDIQLMKYLHLNIAIVHQITPPVSKTFMYILIAIAASILIIACINYMNLSISRYTERTKEVYVRKVVGAQKRQLIIQFLNESILLSFLSLIIGIGMAELFLPELNMLIGKDLTFTSGNPITLILLLLAFGLLLGILVGSYPAFFLSASRSLFSLRSLSDYRTNRKLVLRRILIVLQFAISILLIFCTLIVNQQIHFMKNHDLGFNEENIVVMDVNQTAIDKSEQKARVLLNTINAHKVQIGIISACLSENVPGLYFQNTFGIIPEGWSNKQPLEMIVSRSMGENFFDTYGLELVEGRKFSSEFGTDKTEAVILNETAVKASGWTSAVGKKIRYVQGGEFTVIGVVNDIHFKSLKTKIEPIIYRHTGDYFHDFLSVRIRPDNINSVLEFIKQQWQTIIPNAAFEYKFLSDEYEASYQKETKTLELIALFSLIAVILACTGLLGLTALSVAQRNKEIGIRKVLGASVAGLITLLSKEFIKWVLLANLIAWPVAYYAMNKWLQNFAYRTNIGWLTF
ncbi:MAG: ABC transporter permease, partial [bacterium]